MKINKTTMWQIIIIPVLAALLTAYIMPFLETKIISLRIEENAMLRRLLIEFIFRPVIAIAISILIFYLTSTFLKEHAGCLAWLATILLALFLNAVIVIIQTPILVEWLFMIFREWNK